LGSPKPINMEEYFNILYSPILVIIIFIAYLLMVATGYIQKKLREKDLI
jgi:hypothetical protein